MTSRKPWIGSSWKMTKTRADAREIASRIAAEAGDRVDDARLFVIPSFTAIAEVADILAGSGVKVGVQNMHWADDGAWTGEISPRMVKECGATLVEIGHSERRAHFGETDETVGLKVEAAVRHGLIPLICIGETLADRESGRADEVLAGEVKGALGKLSAEQRQAAILLAYEPVWAIGEKGIPATADYADARQAEILKVAESILGRRVPCLYGGSVNPGNCAELIACPHIDGLFIGRSAWEAEGYLDILARCSKALR